MNLTEALAAVRALDLPQPRKLELIRRLVDAPSTGVWKLLVAEGRAEATHNRLSNRAEAAELLERRYADDERRRAEDARREPYKPTSEHPEPWIPSAPPRPVTVTWSRPRHPEKSRVESRPELPDSGMCPPEHRHGSSLCYSHHRCRCDTCRRGNRERTYRHRRGEVTPRQDRPTHTCPDDHAHGLNTTCYGKHRCRCEPCRNAKRRETARHAERRAQK